MINNWQQFNENRELDELLSLDNASEIREFFIRNKYKDYESIIDFRNLIVINNGMYGLVYTYVGQKSYFKLTYDKNSYLLSRKLLGKKSKHLLNIESINVVTKGAFISNKKISNNFGELFVIKMEECDGISEAIYKVLENINDVIIGYMKDAKTSSIDFSDPSNFDIYYSKEDALESMITYLYEDEILSELDMNYLEKINIIDQLKETKKELLKFGFTKNFLDIHTDNVMFKKGTNNICLIDFISPEK